MHRSRVLLPVLLPGLLLVLLPAPASALVSAAPPSAVRSPSASPAVTPAPTATPAPAPRATDGATATPSTATGTPTPTASAAPTPSTATVVISETSPQRVVLTSSTSLLTAGASAVVTATATPGQQVRLYAYTRPSTVLRLVRSGVLGEDGTLSWTVVPTASTRFVAELGTPQESAPLVLPVAARATYERTSGCDHRGAFYPAAAGAGGVSLVRLVDERVVLLARAEVDARGRYAVRRCLSGSTGDEVLTVRVRPTLTWVLPPLPVSVTHYDCVARCLPGADVVVTGPAADRAVVLERQQGLLLKVPSQPSTGAVVRATASGGVLVGPEESFVRGPSPGAGPQAGAEGRAFFRFVAARPGRGTVVVTSTPRDGSPEVVLRVRVAVR